VTDVPGHPDGSAVDLQTASPDQTRDVAAALARLARAGDVVLLAGELGAGKTAFAQGFGVALGIQDQIVSPTFTIARQYLGGRLVLHHLDVYRLDHLREATDLGLAELLDDGGVALIEWGDAIVPVLPADFLEIRITFGAGDDDRQLRLTPVGAAWTARSRAMRDALQPWTAGA
jgi:tRNA threonylcarbamoyladenosine biosynthesis protein TsaE